MRKIISLTRENILKWYLNWVSWVDALGGTNSRIQTCFLKTCENSENDMEWCQNKKWINKQQIIHKVLKSFCELNRGKDF